MPNIGPMELVIVLAVALLVLGPKRLPAAGRSLGRGIREFRTGISGKDDADPEPLRQRPAAIAAGEAHGSEERRREASAA